jgi:hypothetical protein
VKSVDTRDLKSLARKGVPVQVRPRAPFSSAIYRILFFSACFNLTFSKFPYRA